MSDRLLLRGGYVLSMDESVGELPGGDVLIEDGAIAAVEDARRRGGCRGAGRLRARGHARVRRHAPAHLADAVSRRLRGLDARGLLPRDPHVDLPQLRRRGRVRRQLRRCARSARSGRHDDSRLLPLQQHARARRRARSRACATPAFARCSPTATTRRRRPSRCSPSTSSGWPTPGASASGDLSSEDALVTMGVALTEVGLLPFEQTIAEARSARELGVPSVLHTGCNWGSLATEGIPELDHHRSAERRAGARALQHARRAQLPPAGRQRLQGVLQPRDRDPDGHGPPGHPPRARARDAPEPVLRRHVLQLGRHVQPDADRPAVRAVHAQRRASTRATRCPSRSI